MRLALIDDEGTILDTSETFDVEAWNYSRDESALAARLLLQETASALDVAPG